MKDIVVAVTGASGMAYAVELLERLSNSEDIRIHLVASDKGMEILEHETGRNLESFRSIVYEIYDNEDLSASIASGSVGYGAVVVSPCSMNTIAKMAVGIEDNLITRVAAVALKERRKLVLMPRETPISDIHLDGMARLFRSGAVIMPAMPGFYNRPESMEDIICFMVARILDQLGLEHDIEGWGSTSQ